MRRKQIAYKPGQEYQSREQQAAANPRYRATTPKLRGASHSGRSTVAQTSCSSKSAAFSQDEPQSFGKSKLCATFTVEKKRSVRNGRRNRGMASCVPTGAILFQAEKPQTEKRGLR